MTSRASAASTGSAKLAATTTGSSRYAANSGSHWPRPPEPYRVHRPRPRSTSAADDGPATAAGVSELSTTVTPAPRASTDGSTQYADTAATSAAHRATAASAAHSGARTASTTTGTASSCSSGTTPALVPLIAANASAKPAGHRQARQPRSPARADRSAFTRQSSCQGSSAHGSRIGWVAPATTRYGFATNTTPATSGPTVVSPSRRTAR